MADRIDPINQKINFSVVGSCSQPLTAETRRKLIRLGINPDNIKTEAEGQAKLKEALASIAAAAAKSLQAQPSTDKNASMDSRARALAINIAVMTGNGDKIDFIYKIILQKLVESSNVTQDNQAQKIYSDEDELKFQAYDKKTGASALSEYEKFKLNLKAAEKK